MRYIRLFTFNGPAVVAGCNFLRLFRLLSIAAGLLLHSGSLKSADGVKIAVVWSKDAGDLGTLIESELAKRDGIVLLERDGIDAVFSEIQISARGISRETKKKISVLGADGLVFLTGTATQTGSGIRDLTVRFVESKTGAVIGWYAPPVGAVISVDAETAKNLSRKIQISSQKLTSFESLIPVSFLGLRPAEGVANYKSLRTINGLSALLARRLTEIPGIVLLERSRMSDLVFETQLAGKDTGSFWAGAIVLDGTIELSAPNGGGKLVMTLPTGEKKTSTAPLTDDPVLFVEKLAASLSENLGDPGLLANGKRGDKGKEAQLLKNEARWALSNKLFRQATSASEASILLGGDDIDTFLMNLNSRIERCEQLQFGRVHTLNYGSFVDSANTLLDQLRQNDEVLPGEKLEWYTRGMEAGTRVLFFGYRNNYHLSEDSESMGQLRKSLRETFQLADIIFQKAALPEKRWYKRYADWDMVVKRAGGLWFDSEEEGQEHLMSRVLDDENFVPFSDTGYPLDLFFPRYLVPVGVDWEQACYYPRLLEKWDLFAKDLQHHKNPVIKLKGVLVAIHMRNWFQLMFESNYMLKKEPSPFVDKYIEEYARFESGLVLETVLKQSDYFVRHNEYDFFYGELGRAASKLPRDEAGNWRGDEGPLFSRFCMDVLRESKVIQPVLTEMLLGQSRTLGRYKPIQDILGFRLPPDEHQHLLAVLEKYRKRLMTASDFSYDDSFFELEMAVAKAESTSLEAKIDPDALMVLRKPIHIGLPPRPLTTLEWNGMNAFFDHKWDDVVRYGLIHSKVKDGVGRVPVSIEIFARDLKTGAEVSKMEVPVPAGISEKGKFSRVHSAMFGSSRKSFLIFLHLVPLGGNGNLGRSDIDSYLIDIDRKTKEVVYTKLGPVAVVGSLVFKKEDELCFFQAVNPKGNKISQKMVMRYDLSTKVLSSIGNTSRRPARFFLDDRSLYHIYSFSSGLDGFPLLLASFGQTQRNRTGVVSSVLWNDAEQHWQKFRAKRSSQRFWMGYGAEAVGEFITRSANKELWLTMPDDRDVSFFGNRNETRYLRPPDRYEEYPIASETSKDGVISGPALAVTPDHRLFQLRVRKVDGRDTPVLRCFDAKYGKRHFDLVVRLDDQPMIFLNQSGWGVKPSPPEKGGYGWQLEQWSGGLALLYRGKWQQNIYVIPNEMIDERLKKLHSRRDGLTEFETLQAGDIDTVGRIDGSDLTRREIEKAILSEDEKNLRRLHQRGIPWNVGLGKEALFPIHYAAFHGKTDSMKILNEFGGDLDALCHGTAPVVFAIRSRNARMIRYLFEQNIKTDLSRSHQSVSPVLEALDTGDRNVIDLVWSFIGKEQELSLLDYISGLETDVRDLGLMGALDSLSEMTEEKK